MPLHFAAYYGASPNYLGLLLDHGAEINSGDGRGVTALHLAARGWDARKVGLLIKRGANVNAVDSLGRTPLDMAIECRRPEPADLIRRHGGTASGRGIPSPK
jgi:ankyrin repeat protein